MSTARSYRQFCGVARAMDVLGERWTVLILRELMLGPRRYGDLAANLPGIGTNLLAARLRSLEEAGIVRRTVLGPPANVPAYELTERGEGLRRPMSSLALWGLQLLDEAPDEDETARAAWAAMSMAAELEREGGTDERGVVGFEVDDERFQLTLSDRGARVRQGIPPDPDVTLRAGRWAFLGLAAGKLTLEEAVGDGRIVVDGDRALLERVLERFRLPARSAA